MTKLKRLVAVALAFLMILGSVSAVAYAWDANTDDGFALGITTKIFRQVNGEWIETDKVKAGETVKARVYLDTDYFSNAGQFLLFYNKDFFSDSYPASENTLVVNPYYATTPYSISGNFWTEATATRVEQTMIAAGKITSDFAEANNFINVLYVFGGGATNQTLKGNQWFCEFELSVNDDATGIGDFFVVPETMSSPSFQRGAIDISKGPAGGTNANVASMATWQAVLTAESNPVSLFVNPVTATFKSTDGHFENGKSVLMIENDAGSAISVEEPVSSTANFMGWRVEGTEDEPSAVTTLPDADTTYEAVWASSIISGETLGFRTEIYRYDDEAGEWVFTEKVKPGEQVKARIFVDASYYTNSGEIVIFYDSDFFESEYATVKQQLTSFNSDPASSAAVNHASGFIRQLPASVINNIFVRNGYIAADDVANETALHISYSFEPDVGSSLTGETWFVELDLTVKDDATGWGDVFTMEETFTTPERLYAMGNIPYAKEEGASNEYSLGMWLWEPTIDVTSNPVSTYSSITFDANTGSFDADDPDTFVIEGNIGDNIDASLIPAISKAGSTFMGWYPAEIADPDIADIIDIPEELDYEEIVLKAFWISQVDITFTYNNGDADTVITVTPGYAFEDVADPEKTGYYFVGWTTDPTYRTVTGLPAVYPDTDTVYYAVFEANTYTATYYVLNPETNKFDVVSYAEVIYGEEIPTTPPTYNVPDGYVLSDAYTDVTFSDVLADGAVMPEENVNLYYSISAGTFDALFYLDEEQTNLYETVPTVYGELISTPDDPESPVEGYKFLAWMPAVGIMDSEGKVFVATWEPADYTAVYYVDGEIYESYDIAYGEDVDVPADPYIEGYDFIGWTPAIPGTMPAEDLSFYAQFEAIEYISEFYLEEDDVDDENVDPYQTVTTAYGEAIDVPADPAKQGYVFAGWDPAVPTTMPAENMTFIAQWDPAADTPYVIKVYVMDTEGDYNLQNTFNKTGKTDSTAEYDPIILEGFELDEDNSVLSAAIAPDGSTELVVYIARNEYTIVFDPDNGNEPETATYLHDSTVVAPADPEKVGYTFTGWEPEVVRAAVADATYVAQWSINQYTITFDTDGGSAIEAITQDYGTDVTAPENPVKEGYTFINWDVEIPATMPAEDVTVTALWEINQYTADFYLGTDDTETYASVATNYGEAIALPAEPTKEGYDFVGWDNVPDTMPAENIEVYAVWEAVDYNATFYVDGNVYKTTEVAYDSAIAAPDSPDKTGYTFEGWAETENGTVLADLGIMDSVDGKTFYAVFTPNTYDATFMTDGSVHDVISAEFDSNIDLPEDPTKEGYTFAGWSPTVGVMDEEGKVFEATWTVNSYTITWDTGDTNTVDTYNYGATVIPAANPAKEGYTFAGWDTTVPTTMPAEDLVITATWDVNTYTITWIVDGEITIEDVDYGESVSAPVIAKDGYDFAGWTDLAGNEAEVPATMPANDLVFKATWEAIEVSFSVIVHYTNTAGTAVDNEYEGYGITGYTVEVTDTDQGEDETVYVIIGLDITYPTGYMVDESRANEFTGTIAGDGSTILDIYLVPVKYTATFNVDGSEYSVRTADYGTLISTLVPADPEKTGYTFAGWAPEIGATTRLQSNRTFEATWTVNEYTITFDADGGKFADDAETNEVTASYGDGFIVPDTPTKEGYTFLRWDIAVPATMPAEDITITAIWVANNYTITFDTDGGSVVYPITQNYATAVTAPADPTKTGYSFAGWDTTIPATMPAQDITITATWTPENYTVNFISDGEVYETATVAFDSAIEAPATAPAKTGYEFAGWAAAEGGSVLADLGTMNSVDGKTFYAVFTPNTYDATFMTDGSVYEVVSAEFDSEIAIPDDPTKEGYTFAGWTPAVGVMDEEGKVFEATWTVNSYTVTWNVDSSKTTESYNYGEAITAPADPAKEGYTFAGWTPAVATTMPANDLEYVATWTAKSYTVEYKADGANYFGPNNVTFGSNIPTPTAAPEKTGYTFSGWEDADGKAPAAYGTMPAKNLVFEAVWAANTNIAYDLEIYEMGTNGSYPATPTSKIVFTDGIVGENITAAYTAPEGFTVDSNLSTISGEIPATGKLVLTVYAARSQWKLTTVVDGNNTSETNYYYNAVVAAPDAPIKEGYTFTGWNPDVPAVMPNEDVTLTATWAVNSYTITFADTGDTAVDPITADYGTAITAPAAPTKTGYSFAGWDAEVPTTMPAENMTITALWTANEYTITFDTDGGSDVAPIVQDYGTAVTAPADPTKTGYTFLGWDTVIPATMPADNMTVTARWTPNTYDAVFYKDVDDTSAYATVPAIFGTQINVPIEPTKEGYTFAGWEDEDGNIGVDTMDKEGKIFTATWTINSYNVKFMNDDEIVSESNYSYGSIILEATSPVKEGYTFEGWAYEGTTDCVTFDEGNPVVPANDVIFVAVWTATPYRLTYRSFGVSTYAEYEVAYGTPASDMPVPEGIPTRTGYTFLGWNSLPETMPARQVIITGRWSANEYTITFADTGDTVIDPIVANYNQSIVDLIPTDEPEKTGYTFAGWDNIIPDTMPAEDMTITAIWDVNAYTITFADTGDTVIDPITQDYGTDVTAPAAPTKEGYTFTGWDVEVPATMPAEDMTVTAQWEINTYTITFANTGDTVIDPITQNYGTDITAPANPVKEGYSFTGWDVEIPTTMPASDVVITAIWSVNVYTVEYISDGETYYGPCDAEYGSTIPAPVAAPEKIGYTFRGWEDADGNAPTAYGTMPAQNLVFEAVWAANNNIGYELEVYEMDTNGNYPATPTSKIVFTDGVVGENRTATYTAPEGFTVDSGLSTISGEIPATGKLVLTIYVARNQLTLTTVVDGVTSETNYYYNAVVATPDEPIKEGYTFTGWTPAVPDVMPNEDVTLTAQFNCNSYSVTFSATDGEFEDGTTTKTYDLPYGDDIEAPADPTRTGFAFEGWAKADDPTTIVTDFGTVGAENVEYVAVWSKTDYVVKFYNYIESEYGPAVTTTMYVYDETAYNYGDEIVFPADPSFDNYVFTGWVDENGNSVQEGITMPESDVNIYATFERVVIKLIPKSESSTTMIERNGVIESYNSGYTVTQEGYDRPENFDNYFVYGLEEVLTAEKLLSTYIDVQGDGEIKLVLANENFIRFYGTGAKIQVFDRVTGELVEEFYIIIYGDINGDSYIRSTDAVLVADEVNMLTMWSDSYSEEYCSYKAKAGEVTDMKDGYLRPADYQIIGDHVNYTGIINQITGTIEY